MKSFRALLLLLICSSWSFAQDVDFANSFKLQKSEDNGELVLSRTDCVMFLTQDGKVGCYDTYNNEMFTNGTWELAGKSHLKVHRDGFVVKYLIHSKTATEMIISPVDHPERLMYFAK